jgi:hypothetical protein
MKTEKKRTALRRDFAQSKAVLSVVLGRPRRKRMTGFTIGPLDEAELTKRSLEAISRE